MNRKFFVSYCVNEIITHPTNNTPPRYFFYDCVLTVTSSSNEDILYEIKEALKKRLWNPSCNVVILYFRPL